MEANSSRPPLPVEVRVRALPVGAAYETISQFVSSLSDRTALYAARISGLLAPDIVLVHESIIGARGTGGVVGGGGSTALG